MGQLKDAILDLLTRERNVSFDPVDPDHSDDLERAAAARRFYVRRGGKLIEVTGAPERETRA